MGSEQVFMGCKWGIHGSSGHQVRLRGHLWAGYTGKAGGQMRKHLVSAKESPKVGMSCPVMTAVR